MESDVAKIGGQRNFGYGKQMEWAGKQALKDRYGGGHHGTVAAHAERWKQFAAWTKNTFGVRDARSVDNTVVHAYGKEVAGRVAENRLSVSYAQNLLSTVNVVLESMRGDRLVRVAPAEVVGQRSHVRTAAPAGLGRQAVRQCAEELRQAGHERIASVVELAREIGLRLREASMLDARVALHQAVNGGAVNITAGTKGGRRHHVDRWVPVSGAAVDALRSAATVQGTGRNVIPEDKTWRQWNDHVHHVWASFREGHNLGKLHDLRSAYACERYQALTGSPAPVIAGRRQASRDLDRSARETIAHELGHARTDIVGAYIGGSR